MKSIRLIVAAAIGCVMAAWPAFAGAAEGDAKFKDDKEKVSYAIGMMWGNQIKVSGFDVDVDTITSGIKDVLAGRETKINESEAKAAITAYQQQQRRQMMDKNKAEGAAFLAENKKKPGVKTHTVTLPDGKSAEMQYKVIKEGDGPKPGTNDIVSVNYRGTLLNGKEFDNSAKRGQAAKFGVGQVVTGWSEALKMMPVGSKWELYIPSDLAYGDMGGRGIEPGSTLVFEVELVSTEAPPPPPPPAASSQPLTSDIIRVPSKEEMDKGAKIEVIKQEDLEKRIKEEKAKAEKEKTDNK